ncbi:BspA family leucine-rich repeat surface protein [Lactobacillus sp. ESL0791]|uniref:BspA family leucine-rich repeat surface protein n=1 Tax=Lactobacillus sp. ESL0791 TaxID=2983234 RepID=UPI0023F8A173|nr:BspA family leucine-rich repeat surface protein [Lactobacillus sp. ESL0791]MDF7639787.1 BspA family leucine-rich repeat surface protein [Lactobacillus sp. ESL0791]
MLSTNNIKEQQRRNSLEDKRERFSLRKLTVGVASVLLGFSFMQINSQVVKADTVEGKTAIVDKKTSKYETQGKSKSAAPKQADLKTYSGLSFFLRSDSETASDSMGDSGDSNSISSAPSSSGTLASEAGSTSKGSTAGSEAVSSAASSAATSVAAAGSNSVQKQPVKVAPQEEVSTRGVTTSGTDGGCTWTYDNSTKTITFVGDGTSNMLGDNSDSRHGITYLIQHPDNGPVITLAGVKAICFDNSDVRTGGTGKGQIKLPANSSNLFAGIDGLKKITGADGLDTSQVTNMSYMFANDPKLLELKLDNWNMSNVAYNNMYGMFSGDQQLRSLSMANSTNTYPVSANQNITIDDNMFSNDIKLEKLILPKIKVSSIKWGYYTSVKGSLKSLDVSQLDTSGLTILKNRDYYYGSAFSDFNRLTTITGIEGLDVSHVKTMYGAFSNDPCLTSLDLSGWDTSGIEKETDDDYRPDGTYEQGAYQYYGGMNQMFSGDTALTELKLGPNWKTDNVYSMANMFSGDKNLTKISGSGHWNMGNVAHAESMFGSNYSDDGAAKLTDEALTNIGVSNWDTSHFKNTQSMFKGASSLTTLDLRNWDTSHVTNMTSMFQDDSKLHVLNLGKDKDSNVQIFTTTPAFDQMYNMFSGIGTKTDSTGALQLTLGNFKINRNAWGTITAKSVAATNLVTIDGESTQNISGDKFYKVEDLYTGTSGPDNTYTFNLYSSDNVRYKLLGSYTAPTIMAHKGQTSLVIKKEDLDGKLGTVFYDSEGTMQNYSITDLKSLDDYFHTNGNVVVKDLQWLDSSMTTAGVPTGTGTGAVDSGGHITNHISDPLTDTQKGNAVVQVNFGDGTHGYVPVNVQIPKITGAGVNTSTQLRNIPSEEKAKAAVKLDGGTAPDSWDDGKWNLSYHWVKGTTWRDLSEDDLGTVSSIPISNVGVKVKYTTPGGDADGSEIVSTGISLKVQNYSQLYNVTYGGATLQAHLKTDPTNPRVESVAVPKELTDPAKWGNFISINTTDGSPVPEHLNDAIKSIEWTTASAPTTTGSHTVTLKVTFKDDSPDNPSTVTIPGVSVNVSGGVVDSGHPNNVGVNGSSWFSESTAKAALTGTSTNAITINFPSPSVSYSWSKDGKNNSNPDVSSDKVGVTQHVYVLIDYHDDTKQAVPVDLNVTSIGQKYTPHITTGQTIKIHRTDSADARDSQGYPRIPIITDANKINDLLTLNNASDLPFSPPPVPSSEVSKIIWDTNHANDPESDGPGTQSKPVIVVYKDGSQESTINSAAFEVEEATIKGSPSHSYLQSEVPTPDSLINLPEDFGDAICEWVKNDNTHEELSLTQLNNASGTVDAAIAVTYADNTHQYLPFSLTISSRSGLNDYTKIPKTVHLNQHLSPDELVKITQRGTNIPVSRSDYDLEWVDGAPDLSAAALGNATEKEISKTIKVIFNNDHSVHEVHVSITLVGAQKRSTAAAKKVYLGNPGMNLTPDQVTTIVPYYLDISKIGSLASYTLTPTGDTVTLTVTYNDDGTQQTFTDIPLKLVKNNVDNNAVINVNKGDSIGADDIRPVLLNYDEVASTGAEIGGVTGINTTHSGLQHGNFKIIYPGDNDLGLNELDVMVPVAVDVGDAKQKTPSISTMPSIHPGSIIVPQYTDLLTHNEYAQNAVTNTNTMPKGVQYIWDKDHIPATDKEGTYSGFVNVRYANGTFASVPVTVQVVAPSLDEAILMHNSYIYNQDANRVTNRVLQRGLKVKTYGTTLIDGKLYYHLEDNQYVKAGNIDGQTRQIAKTAYIYNHAGKRVEDQVIYKGTKVKTYGAAVKIDHDKYYTLGLEKFIKAETVR